MEQNIVLTTELQEKFKSAWGQRQVILFTAPCGCGKSAAASALLEPHTVCRWDALSDPPEPVPDFTCDAVLLDNLQAMKNPNAQQSLCEAIRQHPEIHFVLLSRGTIPGWLMPFRYEPRMQVFEMKDLMLDQETAEKVLNLAGVSPSPAEMSVIMERSMGYPLAMSILCQQMQDGRRYGDAVDADVRRELFVHFRTAVYLRFEPPARRLLLNLAPFEPFDVEFAQILSGNSHAGELLGELQQDTSMFLYDDLHHCRFLPDFRQYLLWQQEREYSAEEQNRLYSRAALYYELHDDYKSALDCYTRCGEYQKVSDLLIKNSELHPGLAHYDEMEDYYRALPREQILSSPALMAGMSMLSSICMDYDASEAWYLELERCAGRLKRSDTDYKSVRGWLAWLDIGLPQRNVNDILTKLNNVVNLLTSKEIVMPEFSVTSRLPSIMNGGKDFCEWSRNDDALYRKYRIPVSFLLKRDGVALPECAVAESKFEKGEEISGRMLDLLGRLEKIQKKGTPDIEFALIGLLVRLRIDQGEADRAMEHLEALRERFQRPDCQRFLPNLDALMCRTAMYQGNDEAVDTWYREKAPKTIRSKGEYVPTLSTYYGTAVTIRGEGTVISEQGYGFSVGGTTTLEGGTFISGAANCGGVYVQAGKLIVTGEAVVIENTGGGTGLGVGYNAEAQLSGGTCEGGAAAIEIYGGTGTLAGLLNQEGASRVAYYKDNTTLVTEGLDGQTLPGGSYTVKACTHTGEGVCTYTHIENTSTHTKTCLACGKTWDAEDCDYGEYTHNDTGHTRICKLCEYQNVEAHNIKCTAEASGTVIAVSEACKTCGYGKDLGTVTIHIPKLVYGDLTGVVTAENTLTEPVAVAGNVKNPLGETIIFSDHVIIDPPTMDTLTGNAFLSAGEHKIKINIVIIRDENALAECELTFNVDPAPLTPSITGTATKTYDGTTNCDGTSLPIALDGVVNGDTVTATATSYAYDNANAGENKTITASGITLTGADAGNYELSSTTATTTGTITKSQPAIAFADGYNPGKTYDGQTISNPTADDLTITGANFSDVTFEWSATPKDAGTYTLTANIKETPNTAAASTSPLTVTISKATLTATGATVASKTYDTTKTAAVSGVTFTGLVNGETLALGTDYTASGEFDSENAGTGKSVTVTVTLTSDKAKNYNLAQNTTTATGTINRASSSITKAPTASGITYGEALRDSTLTDGEGSVAGAFSWTAPATKPNAGTAQYEVMFTPSDTNYDTAKVNVSVTVAKATPILTAPTAGAIQYGQKLSDSTLTGGTATNPNGNAAVAGSWSWASGNTRPTADGDFPVAFVPGDTANYNTPGNVDASVTVTPAAPKITLTVPAYQVAGKGVTVTCKVENPYDAAFTDGIPSATLTYKIGDGAEQTLTGTSFTIPEGTAKDTVITVTASTAAVDGKYTAATKTATVTVTDKIPVEISGVGVTGRAYNGKAINHTGTPVIKTLDGKTVTDATVTYTWSSGGDTGPINAGNYTLTITVNDGKYIGSTTVDFTIEKATVTITAVNKSAVVGSAQPELTYTVSGLADGETLATAPTLTCTPDMNTVGSYPITASGAAVPNTTNYNEAITYVAGTLSVTAKPSTGGGGYVPSDPGGSTLPVTTTGQGSTTTTTTTTAAPTASVNNGTATTTINTAMGNEIVRQATANKSENVVIAPSVTGNVTKAEVSIPASTVGQIGSQTNASLTVSTPVADVTIPNGGLGSLGSAGGTVIVTAQQTGNSVELTVTAGGQTVQNVPGGVTLTVPAASTTPGTVAVLVHENGTREVVRKSMADNGTVTIPLDGSAKLEIVDNSRQFADVPATSWAADAVAFASAHELFGGTGANQFSPDLPMSRGMLAVVLHNLENNPAQALTGAFADVDNSQWYAEGVAWAEAQGIIGGYGNGWFGPNDNITREQLAVMLWRYSGSPAATDRELHFADAHRASDWALDALRWATENGIINGKGGGILDPTGQATRAEAAQMLKNFMEDR